MPSNPSFEVEASVTDRFQTTLPSAVRKVLGIGKREKIVYRVRPDGVEIARAGSGSGEDDALGPFLALLDRRFETRPRNIVPYTEADSAEDIELVAGVKLG